MSNKNLYYDKYLKYKNKYLNLQNQIGGVYDIPLILKREHSKVITCQGDELTCWAHSTTRIIIKIIKNIFTKYFSKYNEECNYYYRTTKCSNDKFNIFDCFLQIKFGTYTCNYKDGTEDEIDWLDENLSALLFHFIFKTLIDQYGRKKGVVVYISCFYILDYLTYIDITEDLIKTTLAYKNEAYTDKEQSYFKLLITKLVEIFKDVKDNLSTKRLNPICYIIQNNPLQPVYSISQHIYYTPSLRYDGDECENIIPVKISFLDKIKAKIPFSRNNLESWKTIYHNLQKNLNTNDCLITLKYVLDEGFYAILSTSNHCITITGYYVDDDDVFLNIKNSWGLNSCIEDEEWCDLIEHKKISTNKLFKWDKNFNICFFYPKDYTYISTISKDSLDNKEIKSFLYLLNNTKQLENSKLTNLTISNSKFEIDDLIILNEILIKKNNLQELQLIRNDIDSSLYKTLAIGLKKNQSLTKINFTTINFDNEGIKALVLALEGNTKLITLELVNCYFPSEGIKVLADFLKTNKILTKINLSYCYIMDNEAIVLAEMLKNNISLTEINLNYNNIGPIGFKALTEALKTNQSLKILYYEFNFIGEMRAISLAKVFKINRTITMFYLKSNEIGNKGVVVLAEALKTNTTITTLDLTSNDIGDDGARALAEALKTNTTLTTLDLRSNDIGDDGAASLAIGLGQNNTIINCNLEENKITGNGYYKLYEILSDTKKISFSN